MGKLHELLAADPELKAEAQRAVSRVKQIFTDGKAQLVAQVRTYQPLQEGGETFPDEVTIMATSVSSELDIFKSSFGRWMDAAAQKEITNVSTSADVFIDGELLIEGVPAPALLNLEGKLKELRQVYAAIPTNDPALRWNWDDQNECWTSVPRETHRTKKVPRTHVAYDATPEHPAQTETYHEDVRVGAWTTTFQSGCITPRQKRELLARIDVLATAVKKARQRANDVEHSEVHIAETLFDFIHRE